MRLGEGNLPFPFLDTSRIIPYLYTMRILTLNTWIFSRHLNPKDTNYWRKRSQALRECIEDLQPDVIGLQECYLPVYCYIPKGYKLASHSFGNPIFVRKGFKVGHRRKSVKWGYNLAELTHNGITIDFCNVHPSADCWTDARRREETQNKYAELGADLYGGDWNFQPADNNFTYHFYDRGTYGSRILDYFASWTNERCIVNTIYKTYRDDGGVMSDHLPVVIDLIP